MNVAVKNQCSQAVSKVEESKLSDITQNISAYLFWPQDNLTQLYLAKDSSIQFVKERISEHSKNKDLLYGIYLKVLI